MMGWIRVHRSLLNHALWLGDRFTRGQAWIDLLLLTSWANHTSIAGNTAVPVQRGQVLTSQTKLAAKWKWNRETVARFLAMLKRLEMIDIETSKRTDTGYTLITILNYEMFQGGDSAESSIQTDILPAIEARIRPASDQHRAGTIKKGKKGKKGEEGTSGAVAPSVGALAAEADGFARFWNAYPKKKGKATALKEWTKLAPDAELQDVILRAVETQRTWPAWTKDRGQFIPHPATWVRWRRWEDQDMPSQINAGWDSYIPGQEVTVR